MIRGVSIAPAGTARPEPGLRRDARGADQRDRHGGRRRERAVRARLAGAVASAKARWAATRPPIAPAPAATRRRRPKPRRRSRAARRGRRLMASVADGPQPDPRDLDPGDHGPGPAPRSSSSADRLLAAYAICDLEDREFGKTRWGGAFDGDRARRARARVLRPDAAAALRHGPLRRDRGDPPRRRPAAGRVRRRPAGCPGGRPGQLPPRPGPQMVRMWVDRARFRPYPADVRRLLPIDIGELNRLYQLGFASWLPSSADRRRRLLRHPGRGPARRRGGNPRHQPAGRGSRSSATS